MAIIPEHVNGFPWESPIFPTVQPFTYRDGTSYLKILASLDAYVKTLAASLNETLNGADLNLGEQIAALESAVNDALTAQASAVNGVVDAHSAEVAQQLADQAVEVAQQLTDQAVEVAQQLASNSSDVATQLADQTDIFIQAIADIESSALVYSDPVITGIIGDQGTGTRKLLDDTYASSVDIDLAALYGSCTGRPIRTLFLGSSSTSQGDYPRRLGAMIGNEYRVEYGITRGTYTLLSEYNNSAELPGCAFVNAGISGSFSNNYVTPTIINEVARVAPQVIIHMVGSNDFKNQVAPTSYANRIIASVAQLDAPNAKHVFVHAFERADVPGEALYKWSEYGDALRGVAAGVPGSVFVDVSDRFRAAGVPGPDPAKLLLDDKIHLTSAGYDLLARTLFSKLALSTGIRESAVPVSARDVATTDNMWGGTGTNMLERVSDCVYGGTPLTWVGYGADTFARTGATITAGSGSASGGIFFKTGTGHVEFTAYITKGSSLGKLYMDVSRKGPAAAAPNGSGLRARIFHNRVHVEYRDDEHVITVVGVFNEDVTGKILGLRRTLNGGVLTVDGVERLRFRGLPIAAGDYCGFGVAGDPANDFVLRRVAAIYTVDNG